MSNEEKAARKAAAKAARAAKKQLEAEAKAKAEAELTAAGGEDQGMVESTEDQVAALENEGGTVQTEESKYRRVDGRVEPVTEGPQEKLAEEPQAKDGEVEYEYEGDYMAAKYDCETIRGLKVKNIARKGPGFWLVRARK